LFAQVEILENRSKCITEYVVNLCPATEEEGDEEQEVSVASPSLIFRLFPLKLRQLGTNGLALIGR
jgi:hypothetical protein